MGINNKTIYLALILVLSASCTPPYTMNQPDTFKRFEKMRTFQFITADGVMLKGREVENYPKASLDFWTDALKLHMDTKGYVLKSENAFETKKGLAGRTLTFILPYGTQDWVFAVTLFVKEDTIYILESAGPFDRYTALEKELTASLTTFSPNE